MNKLIGRVVSVVLLALIPGCGGGGGGGDGPSPVNSPPAISDFVLFPEGVYAGSGSGTSSVSGNFLFNDTEGNVADLTITTRDASGTVIETIAGPIDGITGITSGMIEISGDIDNTVVGNYRIEVFLTDQGGLDSNVLNHAFRIADFPWVSLAPMATPRTEPGITTLNGQIYVVGGEGYDFGGYTFDPLATMEVYDPATDTWTTAASMPTPRKSPVAAAAGGKLYVIGGSNLPSPGGLSTVEIYDPATDTWTTGAAMPTARHAAAAAVIDGLIYVVGGESAGFQLATIEVYNPATDSWAALPPMPTPRTDLSAAAVNGQLYAMGGYFTTSLSGYQDTVEVFNPLTTSWTTAPAMPQMLSRFAATNLSGKLYVTGGENFARALDGHASYDPATLFWSSRTALPELVTDCKGVAINGKLYVVSGLVTYEYSPANELN